MPFEERIETNRASINYLISSENLLQQQIESLNWEVGKLKSVSSELRSVLSEIGTFKPKSNISHLWSSLEKMEAEFQRGLSIPLEIKVYALAQLSISINSYLMNFCLEYSSRISEEVRQWETVQRRKYWYVWEKTPLFWYNYLYLGKGLNPNIEVSRKLTALRNTNHSLLLYLGASNFILNQYDQLLDDYDSPHSLLQSNAAIVDSVAPASMAPVDLQVHDGKQKPTSLANVSGSNAAGLSANHDKRFVHHKPESKEAFARLLGVVSANQKVIDLVLKLKRHEKPKFEDSLFRKELEKELRDGDITTNRLEIVLEQIKANLAGISSFLDEMKTVTKENRRPMPLQTKWVKYTMIAAGSAILLPVLYEYRGSIASGIFNIGETAKNFWTRYVLTPLKDIYKTIRYDRSSFAFMDDNAIKHDVDDLRKMLTQFVERNNGHKLTAEQLLKLNDDANRGDLRSIMKVYDDLIQQPIKNAVFGDLIELLLIQVQKQKIDVEKAMLALDHLMRANELNFQIIALIPAVFLSGFGVAFIGSYVFRKVNQIKAYNTLRTQIRDVTRLLTLSMEREYLTLEESGLLLVLLDRVRVQTKELPSKQRRYFVQDIHDLESESLTIQQRQHTVERMYRSFPFLSAPPGIEY